MQNIRYALSVAYAAHRNVCIMERRKFECKSFAIVMCVRVFPFCLKSVYRKCFSRSERGYIIV